MAEWRAHFAGRLRTTAWADQEVLQPCLYQAVSKLAHAVFSTRLVLMLIS
jgi:hypothetical protein